MRAAQFRILKLILERVDLPEYIYAFEKGKSIPEMAKIHTGKHVVISLDLKNFFESIKQTRVQELFQLMRFGEKPARELSELCTYKSFVPQGALTSPKLSNLITACSFGPELKEFCDSHGYDLTIYADDVTISYNEPAGSPKDRSRQQVVNVLNFVRATVNKYGFWINSEKTKVMRPYQRQYVCGAVVNRKVNLRRTERNRLRGIVHNCECNGVEAESKKAGMTVEKFGSVVMGRLNWFAQLNPEKGNALKEKFKKAVPSAIEISVSLPASTAATETQALQ